ncbi:response regulator transcription factor [Streptomyces sp. NPDC014894]|uniref:response regulator transcription factor n=1 Tax=unclassified Streptomyces TaxID=2593676 RepID=UPI0036F9D565
MTALLQEEPGFEIVNGCPTAGATGRSNPPDVVLIEDLPTVKIAEAIGPARHFPGETRATRAVVVMRNGRTDRIFGYLRSGVRSFVCADAVPEVLVAAVRATARGEAFLSDDTARLIIDIALPHGPEDVSPAAARTTPLTVREQEIFALLAAGRSNAEIAESCGLSSKTVKFHVSNILRKLGMRNRIQAVVHAAQFTGQGAAA